MLVSRENGLSVKLPEEFLFSPIDQSELESKMSQMFDPSYYAQRVADVAALPLDQTWEMVLAAHMDIISKMEL